MYNKDLIYKCNDFIDSFKGLNPAGTYLFIVNVKNQGNARITSTVNSLDFPLVVSSISPNSVTNEGLTFKAQQKKKQN